MRYIKNEKGIALAMALILAAITLAFSSSLIYIATQSTKISGLQKRYKTALGAAKGGVDLSTKTIEYAGIDPSGLAVIGDPSCLDVKLNNKTVDWTAGGFCAGNQITTDVKSSPDITFTLGAAPNPVYNVSVKVIETIPGNSPPVTGGTGGGQGGIDTQAVVEGGTGSGKIEPMHVPFLYTVEVYTVNSANTDEVSQVTYLYAH
ncbi:MAG: hypothetical protein JSV21_11830 [Nitrospirota bacterium]|nr:MAG: hypothetical protein JSV21_11830 [Nitrospirota bacterium]